MSNTTCDVVDQDPSKRRRLDDSGASEPPRESEAEKQIKELEKERDDLRRKLSESFFICHFAAV